MSKSSARMIKYLPILFIFACSHTPITKKVSEAERPMIKEVPVSSRGEAKKYIHNQRNFLVLLFEQSRDPYYGTPKWKDDCLMDNRIGDVTETKEAVYLSSRLFLNNEGSPGYCFGGEARYGQQIVLYCEGSDKVLDMKFITQKEINLKDYTLCD